MTSPELSTRRKTSPPEKAQPRALAIAAGVLAAVVCYPLARRGIILSDEGVVLGQALEIAHGKVLYKDLDAFVSPGIWYLLAAAFSVFEPTVLLGRLVMLVCFAATTAISARIALRIGPRIAGVAATAGLLVMYVWAFPSWTFAFYSPFAVLFSLAALDRLLVWQARRSRRDLLLTGVLIGLSLSFKQNYGALTLLGAFVALAVACLDEPVGLRASLRRIAHNTGWILFGVFLILGPITAAFAWRGALRPLWDLTVLHLASFGTRQDIPYLPLSALWRKVLLLGSDRLTYGAVPLYSVGNPSELLGAFAGGLALPERLHVLLYWLPPAVFLACLGVALTPLWRKKRPDTPLMAVTLVGGALFLGVFPRADFAHLMNVYQPVVLLFSLLAGRLVARPRTACVRLCLGACCGVAGVYALVALFWYNRIRVQYDHPLQSERAGILAHAMEGESLDAQVAFLRSATAPGEPVLTVPDMTMLNFLAARPVPGRYYNLYEHHIAADEGRGVVDDAERSAVRWAVTRYDDFFSDRVPLRRYAPRLWRYLDAQFDIAAVEADNRALFLHRPANAARESSITPVLHACGQFQKGPGKQSIEHHLLFDTLQQCVSPSSTPAQPFLEQRCTITVPEGGELSLGIGYRKLATAAVEPGTELRAELWLLTQEAAEQARNVAIVPPGMEREYEATGVPPGVLVGNALLISGQLGRNVDGELPSDPKEQIINAFDNVTRVLEAAGASWADVVELQSFHIGLQRQLPIFREVMKRYVTTPAVAQTSIGVGGLRIPGATVEIRARAVPTPERVQAVIRSRALASGSGVTPDLAGAEQVLVERLPVTSKGEWVAPRWREHRIDLSKYGGKTVTLVFRSALWGAVDLEPTEFHPLCLEWREPRIEVELSSAR